MNVPTESWGPHPSSDSERKLNFHVFTSSKQRRKRKFNVVLVQVIKKSALHVQNVLFFIYLLGSFCLTFSFPLPSSCSVSERFGKNACHIFTRYICHSIFVPLVNYFVSLETDIWVERKKSPLFKKKYMFKTKKTKKELYFLFRMNFYYYFYYLLILYLFCARLFQVRTSVLCVR